MDRRAGAGDVRSLVVAPWFPRPMRGPNWRVRQAVHGLAELGPVDLFVFDLRAADPAWVSSMLPVDRVGTVDGYRDRTIARGALARWAVTSSEPLEIAAAPRDAIRRSLATFVDGRRYDVQWCFTANALELAGTVAGAKVALDLNDLDGRRFRQLLDVERPAPSPGRRLKLHLNVRRWDRLQTRAARGADLVYLSGPSEAAACARARYLANAYPGPAEARTGTPPPPPTASFIASNYAPNVDAAEHLLDDLVPALERRVPGLAVRVVGMTTDRVAARHRPPTVEVVGQVESIDEELRRAWVSLAPLRVATGSQLKIIEALAHGIPVVASSRCLGGLTATAGVDLLVADGSDEVADAVGRLVEDDGVAARVASAGRRLYEREHSLERLAPRIAADVRALLDPPAQRAAPSAPVTITVISYNYGRFLREAVDSALAQEGADVRVTIVDDGSTDDTAEVALTYGDAVRYLPKPNGGLSDARNFAAAACETPWILYLDADNRVPPRHIAALLEALRRDPGASYAYCQLQHFGERDDRTAFGDFDLERLKRGNYIDAGALLPTDLVRAHPYDTGLRHGLEDWDFFLGLAAAGHRGTLADTATYFRVHGSSMGSGVQRRGWRRRRTYLRIYRRRWKLLGPSSAAGMVRRMTRNRLRRW